MGSPFGIGGRSTTMAKSCLRCSTSPMQILIPVNMIGLIWTSGICDCQYLVANNASIVPAENILVLLRIHSEKHLNGRWSCINLLGIVQSKTL